MSKELKKQLRQLRGQVIPGKGWKKRQRQVLLAEIKSHTVSEEKKPSLQEQLYCYIQALFPASFLQKAVKPVGVFVLMITIALSSGIATVGASMNSVPGDTLYTVKRATEKVRLTFTPGEAEKIKLQLHFANNRIEEIDKLNKLESKNKTVKIKETIDSLREGLDTVREGILKASEEKELQDDIMEAVRHIDVKTVAFESTLSQTEEGLNDNSADIKEENENKEDMQNAKEVSESVANALDSLENTTLEALKILVFGEKTEKVKVTNKELRGRLSLEVDKLKEDTGEDVINLKELSGQTEEKINYDELDPQLKEVKDKLDQTALAIDTINEKLDKNAFKEVFNDIVFHKESLREVNDHLVSLLEEKKQQQQELEQQKEEEEIKSEDAEEGKENVEENQDGEEVVLEEENKAEEENDDEEENKAESGF